MSEERDPGVSIIELQDDLMRHFESGGRKIRALALIATLAGGYFAVSYFVQLVVLPYGLGITSQTVSLVDPGLVAVGLVSLAVSLLWVYAGVRDLVFERRLAKQIREVRRIQSEVAKKYNLDPRA